MLTFLYVYFTSTNTEVKNGYGLCKLLCNLSRFSIFKFKVFSPRGNQGKVGIIERTGLYIDLCTTYQQPHIPRDDYSLV